MGHFLLVVHWTQVSISIRFRDIWRQAYWGHDLDLSGTRDVRYQSRDHSNPNGPFPIGVLLDPSLYF